MTDSNISLLSPDSTARSTVDAQLLKFDPLNAGQKHALETDLGAYALDCSKRAKLSIEKQYSAQEFAKVFRLFLCSTVNLILI